jgi:hypothetical protein
VPTVAKGDAALFAEEGSGRRACMVAARYQPFGDRVAAQGMLSEDSDGPFGCDVAVRIDFFAGTEDIHKGFFITEAKATRLFQLDGKSLALDDGLKFFIYLEPAGGGTAAAEADAQDNRLSLLGHFCHLPVLLAGGAAGAWAAGWPRRSRMMRRAFSGVSFP